MFVPAINPLTFKELTSSPKTKNSFLEGNFIFRNARCALFSFLKTLPKIENRKAWLPAFMCGSVLKPFQESLIEINYYDVDPKTWEPLMQDLPVKAGDIFLFVHFFGIAVDSQKILNFCREKNLISIEDCAHTFPNLESPSPLGLKADAAIYSLRKQFPVIDGGILRLGKGELPFAPTQHKPSNTVSFKSILKKLGLMLAETLAFQVSFNLLPLKEKLKRKMGSTNEDFILDETQEAAPLTQKILGKLAIQKRIVNKIKNYTLISQTLGEKSDFNIPFSHLPENSVPQAFPVLVKKEDREKLIQNYKNRGIQAAHWPGAETISTIPWEKFPHSRKLIDEILLLPCHEGLKLSHINHYLL